jgi:phosphatidylserine synthase 2
MVIATDILNFVLIYMNSTKRRLASYEFLDVDYIKKTRAMTLDTSVAKKSVGIQSIMPPKLYVPPNILATHKLSMIDFPKILYMPHTVFFMLQGVVILLAIAFNCSNQQLSNNQRIKYGICSIFAMVIFFAAVHFPDTLLNRPHPIFWRTITGMFLCYTLILGYMLFQTLDDARSIFKYIDPALGVPLPEKQYAKDCRIYTPEMPCKFHNVWQNLDVYIWSHFIGWTIYMVSIRDRSLCWAISLLFETTELTFKHWLPNYEECWWDSLILDVILCNGLGIEVGGLICKYFEFNTFEWMYREPTKNKGFFTGITKLFKPNVWNKYKWKMFSSVRRYVAVIWFIILSVALQNTNFFLKYLLWIPSSHNLLLTRVLTLGGMGMIATAEYYYFVENKHMRFGTGIWLTHFTLFLEIGLIWKWGRKVFVAPFKASIQAYWSVMFIVVIIGGVYVWHKNKGQKKSTFNPYNPEVEVTEERSEK